MVSIGLVGCGRISVKHIEAIDNNNELNLLAICDTDAESLGVAHNKTNAIKYDNYDLLLENDDIDVIVLCTPSGMHADQTIKAALKGKHVITEKPMATLWEDGVKMVEICKSINTHLFVVKQNRYNKTLQFLKRAILEKRFGKIYSVNINVFWTRPQEYYDQAEWRGTWEMDGGALMNQASHYVDLLTWLIGPIADVHAMTGVLARDIEVEDTAVLNIRWRSGALGSMSVTMLTYPKNMEGSITILGEKGTVKVGGVAVNDIQHWEFEESKDYDNEVKKVNYQTESVYGYGHTEFYNNVIDVLTRGKDPETNGEEGLKSLEILIAAYLSSSSGNIVSLPLAR
jgi:UDP-N-acetyl-2-amino-2-deoxyglucuronate dehydrogenase